MATMPAWWAKRATGGATRESSSCPAAFQLKGWGAKSAGTAQPKERECRRPEQSARECRAASRPNHAGESGARRGSARRPTQRGRRSASGICLEPAEGAGHRRPERLGVRRGRRRSASLGPRLSTDTRASLGRRPFRPAIRSFSGLAAHGRMGGRLLDQESRRSPGIPGKPR